MKLGLQHSYAALPPRFYAELAPEPVRDPRLVAFNDALAREIGLDAAALAQQAAAIFSGNVLPEDARPLAQAYAGHQFGRFTPQLGDGRALLLGELVAADGTRRDLQLKGSGRTPFSRAGDGRAALGPMLREYVISEAMHALGIPTTRSLAVVATGEPVLRESPLPGAVLARVAASHIRVGTFQFFAARGDTEALAALLEHVVGRHYPDARDASSPALALLEQVVARQARLVARWMLAGFIHGVMNTDNMALSGETIDYGPCAFMDAYHPDTVFSSIDHHGRYAWGNQPHVAQWNLARLAECLLPLVDADAGRAVERATAVLESFTGLFDAAFLEGMRAKLGLATARDGDADLAQQWLAALQAGRTDYTNAFRALAGAAEGGTGRAALRALFPPESPIDDWLLRWEARAATEDRPAAERAAAMRAASPAFIPRNHVVERALAAASDEGDVAPFEALLAVVRRPFEDQPGREDYARPPRDDERVLATFCGT